MVIPVSQTVFSDARGSQNLSNGSLVPPVSVHAMLNMTDLATAQPHSGILIFDLEGECVWSNAAAQEHFRTASITSPVGNLTLWSHCSIPGDTQRAVFTEALGGKLVSLPTLEYHANGPGPSALETASLAARATLLPLTDDTGNVVALGIINQFQDASTTDQPTLRDAGYQAKLTHSVQVAKMFAGRTAHDFNNVIAVVQGFSSILCNRLQNDERNRNLAEQIDASGSEALNLTTWLANFANKSPARMAPLDLNKLVDGFLCGRAREKQPEIELKPSLAPGLPPCSGDYVLLEDVCEQLWQNAIDAMPQGGELAWETSCVGSPFAPLEKAPDESRYLRLRVRDTGTGLDDATRSRVFDPFFTTKAGKQRGLGLTQVFEAVQAHCGLIEITSSVGKGTTVDVFLPALDHVQDQLLGEEPAPQSTHLTRVMVVDDEDMVRTMLKEILQELGYDVTTVSSGEEALSLYRQPDSNIEVVILDLGLSGMNGVETFRQLKIHNPDVKVIVSTGDPHQVAVRDLVIEGVMGIVAKPFNPFDLRDMIERLVA